MNNPFSSPGFEELMLSVQRRGEMLEKTQLGKGLDWNEILTLCGFLEAWRGSVGSVVFKQGEKSAFLSVICSGRVNIVKEKSNHSEKVIATLGPGNFLGEMALIDGEPRSAMVVTHTPVELLVLTKANSERLTKEYPRLWGKLVIKVARILSRRLRQTSGVLAEYLEC